MYKYNVLTVQNAVAVLTNGKEMNDFQIKSKLLSLALTSKDLTE